MNWKLPSWLNIEIKPLFRPRQKRPPPLWFRWLSKAMIWLVSLLLVWFAVWRVMLYREINHRFAAIRTAGLPTSGLELNAWRLQVPDSENGALILTQAFVQVRTFPDGRSKTVVEPGLLDRTNHWSAEIRELVAAYVESNALAVATVHEAMQHPHFRFPADFSYGLETELPHLKQLKDTARIVALDAALAADDGKADEWAKQTTLLLGLASTIDEEPTLISHLVRNAIIRMAVNSAERGLNCLHPDDETCRTLQEAFRQVGETNLLAHALIGERVLMIPPFRLSWSEIQGLSQNDNGEGQPKKPQRYSGKPAPILWLSGLFERDLNFYLQTMETSISLAKLPPAESLVLTNFFEQASLVARKKYYFLSGMLLPAFSRVAIREAATQAETEATQVAMAVERFHNAHARWPENLKALTPEFLDQVPTDPFDGAPLRYHLLNRGYVIYSVNSDSHDDGGRAAPFRKKSTDTNSYDLTFTVER